MTLKLKKAFLSPARVERRARIVEAAKALVGARTQGAFDLFHSSLSPIDVVMVAGSPWLSDGLERDFTKDEAGYRKIGGGANTPQMAYFFRSTANLLYYLKRQGFYTPRGASPEPEPGMACFFDWEDRGRFNFSPDRSGIVTEVVDGCISRVVAAVLKQESPHVLFAVEELVITQADAIDRALIGYSDLP